MYAHPMLLSHPPPSHIRPHNSMLQQPAPSTERADCIAVLDVLRRACRALLASDACRRHVRAAVLQLHRNFARAVRDAALQQRRDEAPPGCSADELVTFAHARVHAASKCALDRGFCLLSFFFCSQCARWACGKGGSRLCEGEHESQACVCGCRLAQGAAQAAVLQECRKRLPAKSPAELRALETHWQSARAASAHTQALAAAWHRQHAALHGACAEELQHSHAERLARAGAAAEVRRGGGTALPPVCG